MVNKAGYLTEDELAAGLRRSTPQPGQIWRHYKGGEYEVVAVALMEANHHRVVIYRPLRNMGLVWARPYSEWHDTVGIPTLSGGIRKVPRFEYVRGGEHG